MKRVSRQKETKSTTHYQRFSINYHIIQLIKDVEWKETCFMPGMVTWQLFEALQDIYDLEDDTVFSLVLTYRQGLGAIYWYYNLLQFAISMNLLLYLPMTIHVLLFYEISNYQLQIVTNDN